MMDSLISRFPAQLNEALEIGAAANINAHNKAIHKIYVAGLGGSGIGANFVIEFIRDECQVPMIVGKGYNIPSFVDDNTLALVSSYSGNTEETLHSFDQLLKSGAKVVIISSGGKLIERAKELNLDYIQVPGDWPSPRACLGFSMVQQLFILNKLDLISDEFISKVNKSIDLIKYNSDEIKAEAKNVAKKLYNKVPVIYSTDRIEAVAIRLRQQINENAKRLCWHHVVPEMNHNELVGWTEKNDSYVVVYLRNNDDFKRNQVRIEINKKIISKYAHEIIEIYSKGNSLIEKSIYLIHLGDWISWYLSELHEVDSIEIDVIDYLKSELSKV